MKLSDYEAQIAAIETAGSRLKDDHDIYRERGRPRGAACLCEDLAGLSQSIRSMLWRDRKAAYAVAAKAEQVADRLATRFGLVDVSGRNGRQPIHGSVGRTADGNHSYGGRY